MAHPFMPFFVDAYVGDTRHLTCLEHGAYFQLLTCAWVSSDGSIPDDDKRLARMVGLRSDKWAMVKPAVMAFWTLENGRWTQKRLMKERQFVTAKVALMREKSVLGVAAKALKRKERSQPGGEPNGQLPTPTPTEKNKTPSFTVVKEGTDDPQKALFDRGKDVLGNDAGSIIAKLLKSRGGVVALARSVIEAASAKQNPREYVMGCIKHGAQNGTGKKTYAL